MAPWCRTLVWLLAFALMPTQGIAVTLSVLLCHGDAATQAEKTETHPERAVQHDEPRGEPDAGTGSAEHFCCHAVVAHAPVIAVAAPPGTASRVFLPGPLYSHPYPEQLSRPPLV
jgi:hypothetical protein